jgi:hypothetical protein
VAFIESGKELLHTADDRLASSRIQISVKTSNSAVPAIRARASVRKDEPMLIVGQLDAIGPMGRNVRKPATVLSMRRKQLNCLVQYDRKQGAEGTENPPRKFMFCMKYGIAMAGLRTFLPDKPASARGYSTGVQSIAAPYYALRQHANNPSAPSAPMPPRIV